MKERGMNMDVIIRRETEAGIDAITDVAEKAFLTLAKAA